MSQPTRLSPTPIATTNSSQNTTASLASNASNVKLEKTPSTISTASLASITGIPGWEIQQNGALPLYTNGNQAGGYSVDIGGARNKTLVNPDSQPGTQGAPSQSKRVAIIASVSVLAVTLLSGLLAFYLLKRRRAKRRVSFDMRTTALREKMQAPNAPTHTEVGLD